MTKGKIFRVLKSSIAVISFAVLAGCGKSNTDAEQLSTKSDATTAQKDYVYVAETEELASRYPIYGVCSNDDTLYLATYNEEENDTRCFAIDCLTRKGKPFRLPMEETAKSEVCQMTMDNDGNLVYTEKVTDSEDSVRFCLKTVSLEDWSLKNSIDITEAVGADRMWLGSLAIDKDGNFYVSGTKEIMVLSPEGKLLFETHPNAQWLLGMSRTKGGRVAYMIPSAEDTKGLVLSVLDAKEKSVAQTYEDIPGGNSEGRLATGVEADLLMDCNGAIYQYNLQDGSMQEELRWTDSMINGEEVRHFLPLSDGNMAAVLTKYGFPTRIAYLTKTPRSEVPQKEKLVIATFRDDSNAYMPELVNYFNSHSEDYYVELRTYMQGGYSREEWNMAKTKLLMDIMSEDAPDIIDGGSLDVSQLAAMGAIEDITPFLENDPDLKSVEFFDSVLDMNRIDGKLYSIPDYFRIKSVAAREEDVGQISGLSLEQYMELAENYSGEQDFVDIGGSFLLMDMVGNTPSQWVDWETGECNFDSEEFKEMMEFCKKYGEVLTEEENEEPQPPTTYLQHCYLFNAMDYMALDIYVGGNATVVGFPVDEGATTNGTKIDSVQKFTICANSDNKEGAWEFIKCFLTPEYYDLQLTTFPEGMSFPSRIDIYNQVFDEWMSTETIVDESGEEKTVAKYHYNAGWERFGNEPMTEEDRETLTNIIENASGVKNVNWEIRDIIEEETAPYFLGQKNANEVAKIIQSRVQLYVNENR